MAPAKITYEQLSTELAAFDAKNKYPMAFHPKNGPGFNGNQWSPKRDGDDGASGAGVV